MRATVWFVTAAACSSTLPDGVDGIEGPPAGSFADGGEPGQYSGIVTLDEYDWFAVAPYLGIVRVDLRTGGKRRFLSGRNPWMHPSGRTAFIQPCGDGVSRVAVADAQGLFETVTPCSLEIEGPGYSPGDLGFVKLSPDETRVAVEAFFFVDWGYVYKTLVFEDGAEIARFDDLYAPEWLPDGRLLLSGEGLYVANRALTGVERIDGERLNGPTNNPSVHPDGERIVFEFNQQIWEMNLDGSDLREAVYGGLALRYPTWSPDGSSIAYLGVSQRDYYDKVIYFTDLDRGESTYLDLLPTFGTDPSVVPNGPLSWR